MFVTNKISCYHFIPGNKIFFIKKLSEYIDNTHFKIIFDLEDAVNDIFDSNNSLKLKKEARVKILNFFKLNSKGEFFVRINNPDSVHWNQDKYFLKKLKKYNFKGIVVPKTKKVSELDLISKFINEDVELIPLIETKEGFKNLKSIINHKKVSKIIFGHHDYFNDLNIFPIPKSALTSEKYREAMNFILQLIKGKNIEYIDGIHYDLNGFELEETCQFLCLMAGENKLGKLSVHKNQIKHILYFKNSYNIINIRNDDIVSDDELKEQAKKIITAYESKPSNQGVIKKDDLYISPQMYLQAIEVMKREME